MGKETKTNKAKVKEVGVLKLIKFDPAIIEEKRNQNILLDEFVSVSVDANGNWELYQIRQTTVSNENIKTTTKIYESKYKIGDTYQEWFSMGKYLRSFESAVEYYSNLKFNNEVSQLRYCADVKELVKIRQRIYDDLNNFMIKNAVPEVAKQISRATKELQEITKLANEMKLLTTEATNVCNSTISLMKEKNKIIVDAMPKQKKHRDIKEEA
jgi:hypothetical protein